MSEQEKPCTACGAVHPVAPFNVSKEDGNYLWRVVKGGTLNDRFIGQIGEFYGWSTYGTPLSVTLEFRNIVLPGPGILKEHISYTRECFYPCQLEAFKAQAHEEEADDAPPCPHCGSTKGTWFDRELDENMNMANRCRDCGKDVDRAPELSVTATISPFGIPPGHSPAFPERTVFGQDVFEAAKDSTIQFLIGENNDLKRDNKQLHETLKEERERAIERAARSDKYVEELLRGIISNLGEDWNDWHEADYHDMLAEIGATVMRLEEMEVACYEAKRAFNDFVGEVIDILDIPVRTSPEQDRHDILKALREKYLPSEEQKDAALAALREAYASMDWFVGTYKTSRGIGLLLDGGYAGAVPELYARLKGVAVEWRYLDQATGTVKPFRASMS